MDHIHENHDHVHGKGCGHTAIIHDGHIDYLHDGYCDDHGPIEVVSQINASRSISRLQVGR